MRLEDVGANTLLINFRGKVPGYLANLKPGSELEVFGRTWVVEETRIHFYHDLGTTITSSFRLRVKENFETRADTYGKVKEAVFEAEKAGLTVNEAAERYGFSKRSIRSVADRLKAKLKPMRARRKKSL